MYRTAVEPEDEALLASLLARVDEQEAGGIASAGAGVGAGGGGGGVVEGEISQLARCVSRNASDVVGDIESNMIGPASKLCSALPV